MRQRPCSGQGTQIAPILHEKRGISAHLRANEGRRWTLTPLMPSISAVRAIFRFSMKDREKFPACGLSVHYRSYFTEKYSTAGRQFHTLFRNVFYFRLPDRRCPRHAAEFALAYFMHATLQYTKQRTGKKNGDSDYRHGHTSRKNTGTVRDGFPLVS